MTGDSVSSVALCKTRYLASLRIRETLEQLLFYRHFIIYIR